MKLLVLAGCVRITRQLTANSSQRKATENFSEETMQCSGAACPMSRGHDIAGAPLNAYVKIRHQRMTLQCYTSSLWMTA